MTPAKPHYLLFCDGNYPASDQTALDGKNSKSSRWRFVLEDVDSGEKFEASDRETGATSDRMALVAVLRGLEALEQPSRVTLVTTSRYVFRGLQYGLTEWRDNDYSWEHFGSVQPIRNADLWRRIDRTLSIHKVQCRWISQDNGDETEELTTKPMINADRVSTEAICALTTINDDSIALSQVAIFKDSGMNRTSSCVIPSNDSTHPIDASQTSVTVYSKEEVEKLNASATEQGSHVESAPSTLQYSASTTSEQLAKADPALRTTRLLGKMRRRIKLLWHKGTQVVWHRVLRFDEEIEGYFRCLFLLDPRSPRRSRKSL